MLVLGGAVTGVVAHLVTVVTFHVLAAASAFTGDVSRLATAKNEEQRLSGHVWLIDYCLHSN